jgi:hypothetical protein
MKIERYYLPFVFLTFVACNSGVSTKQPENGGINAPSASEQIASDNRDKMNEARMETASSGDHRFTVRSTGDGSLRTLKVGVTDLKGDTTKADSIEIHDIKGYLKNIAVADLDKDGNPELYCFTQSKGTESAGSVYGVAYLKGKAVTIKSDSIDLADIKGYKGQDSFYVQAPYLIRTYPLYKEGDVTPSGEKQITKYKLEKYTLVQTK